MVNEEQWRTGRHPADEPGPRQRTIYDGRGEFIGSMDTTVLARLVVDAVNGLRPDANDVQWPWHCGVGRNERVIYNGRGELIGLFDTPELARRVVTAVLGL